LENIHLKYEQAMNLLIKIAHFRFGVLLPAALMLFIFSGCAVVGPDYVKPSTPMPKAWHTPAKNNLAGENLNKEALADWWAILDDPILTNLVESSVTGNLDLKEARARVREARARRGISEAGRFPTIDASGSPGRAAAAKKPEAAAKENFTPQASMPPGNWTYLAGKNVPLKRLEPSYRRVKRICGMCLSVCLPKLL